MHELLRQRLPDPLRNAAMHLAFEQHRIDHHAEVVDRGVTEQIDMTGFGIDLDFAYMAAGGKAVSGRLVEVLGPQAGRNFGRQPGGMRGARNIDDAHAAVGARDHE